MRGVLSFQIKMPSDLPLVDSLADACLADFPIQLAFGSEPEGTAVCKVLDMKVFNENGFRVAEFTLEVQPS